MINSGITLMAVGMLVVFAFLTVMVFAMGLMSGFILKVFPEAEESASVQKRISVTGNEIEVAVAIVAAYTQK